MKRALKLLLLLLCGVASGTAGATGPSSVEVRLFPLAARKGAVLFRTRYTINREGAHRFMRTEFGWLVVEARGGWKEAPHRTLEEPGNEADESLAWSELRRLDEEFETPLDWEAPPGSVRGLLGRYGFTREDAVAPDAGAGTVTWSPKGLCQGKRCTAPCRQRSLHGWRSQKRGSPEPLAATFVHSGIAVFRNEEDVEEIHLGAVFAEPPSENIPSWGIDIRDIMAICVLPR